MQALLAEIHSKWRDLLYNERQGLFWGEKNDISELIEDSDVVKNERQVRYAVSHMYLKIMTYIV